jgi:hypothetical protein
MGTQSLKLKWKVSPVPTGPYRSFQKREWPGAVYGDDTPAVAIYCEDEYIPAKVKLGQHAPLKVCVADHSVRPWRWLTLTKRYATLEQAKEAARLCFEQHPELLKKSE